MLTNPKKKKPQHTSKTRYLVYLVNTIKLPKKTQHRFNSTNVGESKLVTSSLFSFPAFTTALSQCLIQSNATCHRGIQRSNVTAHRQLNQQIAMLAYQPADTPS